MHSFAPCPSCGRHVRVSDAACPFCAHAFDAPLVARAPVPSAERVGRAAMFYLGMTLAACGGGAAEQQQPTATMYGGPPMEQQSGGTAAPGGAASSDDAGTPMPPPSATPEQSSATPGSSADAGASTPPDDSPGTVVAMYGVPAPPLEHPDAGAAPSHGHHGHGTSAHHPASPQEPTGPVAAYGAPPHSDPSP